MTRSSVLRCVNLRHFLRNKPRLASPSCLPSSSLNETLISNSNTFTSPAIPSKPFSNSTFTTTAFQFSQHFSNSRTLCSSSGPSSIVSIQSEEEFNSSLKKVQDESLPAIFYFTAVWCGPCRFISPIIGELSEKYPHVMTYKIDIDQDGLENTLNKLNIISVPTLHFFQNGKKASEVIGADVARLKDTVEKLYKQV